MARVHPQTASLRLFPFADRRAPAPRSAEGRLLADLRSIVRRLGQGAARSLLSNTADRFRERVRRRRGHEAELPLFGERKSSRACGRRRAGRDDDRRDSELFEQTITITNTTGQVLRGPMALVLKGLPDGVTLANAGGAYQGNPYVNVLGDGRALAPGQSVIITLEFLVGGRHRKDGDDFSYGLDALLGI